MWLSQELGVPPDVFTSPELLLFIYLLLLIYLSVFHCFVSWTCLLFVILGAYCLFFFMVHKRHGAWKSSYSWRFWCSGSWKEPAYMRGRFWSQSNFKSDIYFCTSCNCPCMVVHRLHQQLKSVRSETRGRKDVSGLQSHSATSKAAGGSWLRANTLHLSPPASAPVFHLNSLCHFDVVLTLLCPGP